MPRFYDDPLSAHIGDKIRALRIARRLSQEDAAALLGVRYQQLQKFERGSNRIPAVALYRLAKKLRVSIGYFFPEGKGAEAERAHSEKRRGVPRRTRSERFAIQRQTAHA